MFIVRRNNNNNNVNLFDEMTNFFSDTFKSKSSFMKADILDKDDNYHIVIDMPGIAKEDIKMNIEDGYLTVAVTKEESKETEDKYIRKERFYQSAERSFYVGSVTENQIKAKLDNGILNIVVPKEKPVQEVKKFIEIE